MATKRKTNQPKILWHGEYVNSTGFAQVSKNLVEFLKRDFDITVLDWQRVFIEGNVTVPQKMDGFSLLGALRNEDYMAMEQLRRLKLNDFDFFFMLNDAWNINFVLPLLKERGFKGKVVCYFPVDAERHDSRWYENFDIVDYPVTYTKFAHKVVSEAAPDISFKLKIIPHGINTKDFFPIPFSKNEIRKRLFGTSIMNNKFIFLNANRNQPRKRLDITLEAFARFAKGKDDVRLYMHCGNTDTSMNIVTLAERLDCVTKIIMTNGTATTSHPKVSNVDLNVIYNGCDVGLNSGLGEGWGLTNTEMGAVGKPQIVPNHSACRELHQGISPLIDCVAPFTLDNIMTVGHLPSIEHMTKLMDKLYSDKDYYAKCAQANLNEFNKPAFLWENIAKQWKTLFIKGS